MEEKIRSSKRLFLFTTIAALILQIYLIFLAFRFEDVMIYLGEKPYKWGDPSMWLNRVLFWFRVATIAMVTSFLGRFFNMRRRPWDLSDGKAMTWTVLIVGLALLANGCYALTVYHGRELYTYDGPFLSSTGQTYLLDTFMYLPLAFAAAETVGGLVVMYKLYWKKGVRNRRS